MNLVVDVIPDFFGQMFAYREFLKQSVLRDLRNKYKRSALGYVWTMLHPLAMMSVLALVFSNLFKFGIKDYAIFLFCGLLPWNYFQSTVMMSLNTIRLNARLFSQVPVPKFLFVISVAFSNFANLLFALAPLLLLMAILGHPFHASALLFPVLLIPVLLTTLGVALLLATLNIFFNDTLHLSEVGLSMLYFLSPILYDRSMLSPEMLKWFQLNPLFYQVEMIRGVFYSGAVPDLATFLWSLLGSFVFLTLGLVVFKRLEDKFLYYI
jgi:ABC-type polysaccharide/polyol phosphate export permease